jgi:hypothetical protein
MADLSRASLEEIADELRCRAKLAFVLLWKKDGEC